MRDASWNLDIQIALFWNAAIASTFRAEFGDDHAAPTAVGASRDHTKHSAKSLLRNLTASTTSWTFDWLRSSFRSRTVACVATITSSECDFDIFAVEYIDQFDLDTGFEVVSANWTASSSA